MRRPPSPESPGLVYVGGIVIVGILLCGAVSTIVLIRDALVGLVS